MQENLVRNILYFSSGPEVPQTTRSEKCESEPVTKRQMEKQEASQR